MRKLLIWTLVIAGLMIVIPLSAAKITAEKVGSKINVTIDNKYFTSYIFSGDEKYPFFYPVNGPVSGGSVTSIRNGETSLTAEITGRKVLNGAGLSL